jgi:carbohydrate-binding DOMON domain-containing protein
MKTISGRMTGGMLLMAFTVMAAAQPVRFQDPVGDDNGPGTYIYPDSEVYSPGSFDMTAVEISLSGRQLHVEACVNSELEDPWGTGAGYAVQMLLVFIDTDRASNSGYTKGLPGTNVRFSPRDSWEKVIILSPQHESHVLAEAKRKAPDLLADGALLVPRRTSGKDKCISGGVPAESVDPSGRYDLRNWRYQVLMQSNEGFPARGDLLTRKVNEKPGKHRFGGGHDRDCDPHVLDVLAPPAKGGEDEISAQHQMLSYECDPEGRATRWATLNLVTAD